MLASLEAVAHSTSRTRFGSASSIQMAADAANQALEKAQAPYSTIDIVINVGVYRDGNICEPAIASLIQEKMGATTAGQPVFSFDLANGACGLVNAFQVVDSLVRTGSARRALIVAADVDPTPRYSVGLDLEPAGVGIVIGSDADEGFDGFRIETFAEYAGSYGGHARWVGAMSPLQSLLSTGTQRIEIDEADTYREEAVECASASVERFLADRDLHLDDVDLVIAPDSPTGFTQRFIERTGLGEQRLATTEGAMARAHTAGPGLSLEAAIADGRFPAAQRTLFVAVGAGITVACALYRR